MHVERTNRERKRLEDNGCCVIVCTSVLWWTGCVGAQSDGCVGGPGPLAAISPASQPADTLRSSLPAVSSGSHWTSAYNTQTTQRAQPLCVYCQSTRVDSVSPWWRHRTVFCVPLCYSNLIFQWGTIQSPYIESWLARRRGLRNGVLDLELEHLCFMQPVVDHHHHACMHPKKLLSNCLWRQQYVFLIAAKGSEQTENSTASVWACCYRYRWNLLE